jgi:hypothetical protein
MGAKKESPTANVAFANIVYFFDMMRKNTPKSRTTV